MTETYRGVWQYAPTKYRKEDNAFEYLRKYLTGSRYGKRLPTSNPERKKYYQFVLKTHIALYIKQIIQQKVMLMDHRLMKFQS